MGPANRGRLLVFGIVPVLALAAGSLGNCDLGKITAGNPSGSGTFGRNASAVAFDGAVALIGESDAKGTAIDSGAAYVFRLAGGTWSEEAKLVGSDSANYDEFGYAVDIEGDVAVVGDKNRDRSKGAVYIFIRDPNTGKWSERQKLAPAADQGDGFGWSVGICRDVIVGGSVGDDDVGMNFGGAVYVYRRNGGTGLWEYETKLHASDGGNVDWFGWDVDVGGERIAVGAPRKSSQRGAVYVFRRDAGVWMQEQKLTAADAANDDFFGESLSLDGASLLVGAYGNDDKGANSGSAYVFCYDLSSGKWIQQVRLLAGDGAADDYFGSSVALWGNLAVIGAMGDDDGASMAGSAYVFTYRSLSEGWQQAEKLTAPVAGASDTFGSSVAAHSRIVVVGSPGDDDAKAEAGAAYVTGGFSDKDCNGNGIADECDIAKGTSSDENGNGVPDECEGDIDGNRQVNSVDFALLGAHWLEENCAAAADCGGADLTGNGRVGTDDLEVLCGNWLAGAQ